MCRLILATGTFDANEIVAGAVAMATGQTADHDSPITNHPDGWGAIWSDQRSATGLSVMRDVRPASESALDSGVGSIETNFLAIHIRRASYPTTIGLKYTHPLERSVDGWYFMHNGSQPTVYQMLGLERSTFDSAEYFDYLVPAGAVRLDMQATRDRLMKIPAGGNSANAFAMCHDRAYVINWQIDLDLWPQYFTMHQLIEPERRIVSSEIIPAIARARYWQKLPPGTLMELRFLENERCKNKGTKA
jgi:glutamine amidotransferase